MDDISTNQDFSNQIVSHDFDSIRRFLNDSKIKEIGYDYREAQNENLEDNMNVFKMVSDLYYRENFHSDVLRFFLTPSEKHKEGTLFLFAFIDFLNEKFRGKIFIAKHDYESADVMREKGRIDLLIKSDFTKHCIIIENKINNAPDMGRQLPRYYDLMRSKGYKIDALVYLPLDSNKKPYTSDWDDADKGHVFPRLCIVPAHQKTGISLVNGWIMPCTLKTQNIDCISILRQYAELVKLLSKNIMDNNILGKFYESLQEAKSVETAQSVQEMMNDLPSYMANRLLEHYKPGESKLKYEAWNWYKDSSHFGIIYDSDEVWHKIDVYSSAQGYYIKVFGQEKSTGNRKIEWADGMKSLEGFYLNDRGEYRKDGFSFYEEAEVIRCVDAIIPEMKERLGK